MPDAQLSMKDVVSTVGAEPISQVERARADFVDGLRQYRVWWTMARYDIGQRYKRSVLGPFWLTITMAVYILGVGPVYGTLFKLDLSHYLPHLALGLVIWGLITNILLESCIAFSSYRNLLISTKLPFTVYIMRVIVRNIIIFLHNLVAVIPFLIFLNMVPSWSWLLAIPGLVLVLVVLLPATYILSILCTRYRDLQPITASVIQLCFFLTPILWLPESFDKKIAILHYNPFWWLVEVIRGPLLNRVPDGYTYGMIFLVLCILLIVSVPLFVRYRRRITFWI